jgi:hypothetical protein
MGVFGNQNTGGTWYSINNELVGGLFTLNTPGFPRSISAYLQAIGIQVAKCSIYDSSQNFVAGTEEINVPDGTAWSTFNLTSPLLPIGNYYLFSWGNTINLLQSAQTTGGTNNFFHDAQVYDGFPDPCGIPGSLLANRTASIYCTLWSQDMVITGNMTW